MDKIFSILEILLSLYMVYFVAIAIGVFVKKERIKESNTKKKFAVLIPARNEERVIRNLFAFSRINDEFKEYDAFLIFDSDNVVHPDFISKMNNVLGSGYRVAQRI